MFKKLRMKKKIIFIYCFTFTFNYIIGQVLVTTNSSNLYTTPFYSWKEQGLSDPKEILYLKEGSKIEAIEFYYYGYENNFVGDLKVKFNDTIGWMPSIVFNSNDLKYVKLINKNTINTTTISKQENVISEKNNIIQMHKNLGGTFSIDCKINNLPLRFIFDTGASDVNISMTEALFMFKNGYLDKDDVIGKDYYQIANGDITEGTIINIKKLEFGNFTLYNVKASISHELKAPLLLGQSALSKLGKIVIDYEKSTLEIIK